MNSMSLAGRCGTLAMVVTVIAAGTISAQEVPRTELATLLRDLLVPDERPAGRPYAWHSADRAGVRWDSDGPREANAAHGAPLERTGRVLLTDGEVPLYGDAETGGDGFWRVALRGARDGVVRAELVSESDAREMELDLPAYLRAAGWEVAPFRCDRSRSPAIFGRVVHRIAAPGARPAWLEEGWDHGATTGMRIALVVHHLEAEAAAVECVER